MFLSLRFLNIFNFQTYLNLEDHQAPYFELKGFNPNGSSETESFVQWMKHGLNVEEDDWLLTAIMKNFLQHLLVKKAWKGMTFGQKMNQIANDVTAYCVLKFVRMPAFFFKFHFSGNLRSRRLSGITIRL